MSDGVAISVVGEYRLTDGDIISRKIKDVKLDEPSGDIIPFESLTKEQVLIWFKGKFDYQLLESEVNSELTSLVNKRDTKVTGNKLPWE